MTAAQRSASVVGRHGPRQIDCRAHDPSALEGPCRRQAGDDAIDVLVRHRRRDQGDRPVDEERAQVVKGGSERGRSGRVVGAIEQDLAPARLEELEPSRPDGRGIPGTPGIGPDPVAIPALAERVEERIGHGDVRGLVPAAEADPGRTQPRQVDLDAVTVPAEESRRDDLGERHAEPARPSPDDRRAPRRSPR